MFRISTFVSLAALAGVLWMLLQNEEQRQADQFFGVVDWVSDGDTFQIEGYPWPIRLWGVDAPERETLAGIRARAFVTDLILGEVLACEKVVVDKYRRTVARCSLGDDDLSLVILAAGHGVEMCGFTRGALGGC